MRNYNIFSFFVSLIMSTYLQYLEQGMAEIKMFYLLSLIHYRNQEIGLIKD